MCNFSDCGQSFIFSHRGSYGDKDFRAWTMLWAFRGSFHQQSHQTGRAWMIYAFVISHLLEQGVNVFVPLHQSSLQRQRCKAGTHVLEEKSKVNQAICPGVPPYSGILWGRYRQSSCDSFVNSDLLHCSHSAFPLCNQETNACNHCVKKLSWQKLWSTAEFHFNLLIIKWLFFAIKLKGNL